MEGRNLETINYRFGYGGHEKIDEVQGSGNVVDMGDRWLDTRIGRTYKQDRNGGSYPFISPYSYVLNNSINVIDPDGKDVYLIVWATSDGKIGHAGIAVDNYKKVETRVLENGKEVTKIEYVKDGTVTYYDLWPGEPVGAGNAGKDVPAVYNIKVTTLDEIKNTDITESEGYAPDGVLKLSTDYATDQKTKEAIEQFMKDNPNYNGRTCNCSDLAEVGVEAVADKNIKANEFIPFKLSTTPNKLFRKTSKLPNAEVVKDPGDKVNKSFLKGVLEKPESERNK
ncbi:MAG: hypothetical protein KatS3mg035_2155 [Bacteroidia bacterium]|nr:MAG: hypothetical protein KatS3mg035_2155 [Bacteroidia bacterium]